ncbi:MAG: ribbon-helix-helix domain-containing protein [Propionibacteriaceae bacterium]|nr:ribbon-helix-helix domain-containing protein [Propionibacteriaceae bacterium]
MVSTYPLTVRVPIGLAERLDVLAKRTRRSKSVYIREAIEAQLDRIEWEQGILEQVESIQNGQAVLSSLDEVRQRLGFSLDEVS